jgi:serine/threonine-protein kinase RsbW
VTEETTTSAIAAERASGRGAGKSAGRAATGSPAAGSTGAGSTGAGSTGAGSTAAASTAAGVDPVVVNPAAARDATAHVDGAAADQVGTATIGEASPDRVTVRMPADGAYLSVLRTATAGLAARLDFTLDDIEDLRIAVDEACAMLLSQAIPGSSLECSFTLSADDMTISVSVPSLNPRTPSGETFAWTVLSALAGTVEAQVGPGDRLAIVMRKSRPSSRSV